MSKEKLNPKAEAGRQKRSYNNVPYEVIQEINDAMNEGADKYGPFNWRDIDIHASDYFNSFMRHVVDGWWLGEDIDPDSQIHHISKAIAGMIVLRDAMINGSFIDDRPDG